MEHAFDNWCKNFAIIELYQCVHFFLQQNCFQKEKTQNLSW